MHRPRKDRGTDPAEIEDFIKKNGLKVLNNYDNTGLHCSKYTKKVREKLLAKAARRRLKATGKSVLSEKQK